MQHAVVCKYSTLFKAHASSLIKCSTWTLNSAYDWWLQNCKLGNEWALVNKIAIIGFTRLFVYESPRRYQERMNANPGVLDTRLFKVKFDNTFLLTYMKPLLNWGSTPIKKEDSYRYVPGSNSTNKTFFLPKYCRWKIRFSIKKVIKYFNSFADYKFIFHLSFTCITDVLSLHISICDRLSVSTYYSKFLFLFIAGLYNIYNKLGSNVLKSEEEGGSAGIWQFFLWKKPVLLWYRIFSSWSQNV